MKLCKKEKKMREKKQPANLMPYLQLSLREEKTALVFMEDFEDEEEKHLSQELVLRISRWPRIIYG